MKKYNTGGLFFSPGLTAALKGVFEYPLTIVDAPMGYGKTTAVREFLSDSGATALWLRLYSGSPEAFWRGFAALFADIDSGLTQRLEKMGALDNPLLLWEAVRLFEGVDFPTKTTLVLDDYHLAGSPESDKFLGMLAESELDNLHIVLITRISRFQQLEELSLKGLLLHITRKVFELRPEEIRAYYQSCGVKIDESRSVKLYSMTEGWVSALYLLMLEYIGTGGFTPPENIYKLLEKTVYAPLGDKPKALILAMSVFDRFTLAQAESVWGGRGAGKILNEIIGKNAFVGYDGKTKTYHIHALFREYLRDIFVEKPPEERVALYRRAAEWHLKTGQLKAAREFLYLCGDFDAILSSMEAEPPKSFSPDNKDKLKKYIDECPPEIRQRHPYALFVMTTHLFIHNEMKAFYKICEEIEQNLQSGESLDGKEKDQLMGELELLYGGMQYNDLKKMTRHFRRARKLMSRPTTIYEGVNDWNMGSPSILCLYHRESGKLREETERLVRGTPCYDELTGGQVGGGEFIMEAEMHFNAGRFEDSEISLHRAVGRANETGRQNILLCAMFLQTRLAFFQRDFDAITTIMADMRQQIAKTSTYHALQTVEICDMAFRSYLNQPVSLPEILNPPDGQGTKLWVFTLPIFNIVYGRALLNSGEHLKLIGSAEQFFAAAGRFHSLMGTIYTYIYLAAANHRINRDSEAEKLLRKALDMALPDEMYMPFAENYDYIGPMLESMAQDDNGGDIERVLTLSKDFAATKEVAIRTFDETKNHA